MAYYFVNIFLPTLAKYFAYLFDTHYQNQRSRHTDDYDFFMFLTDSGVV